MSKTMAAFYHREAKKEIESVAVGNPGSSFSPMCPSWTHSRPAAPRIPGVQVGHISGRQLIESVSLPGKYVNELLYLLEM